MIDYKDIFFTTTPIGTFIVGLLIERYKKKHVILEKNVIVNRFALSMQNDPFFGNINVTYNDENVDNLFLVTIEITNVSNAGIKDLILQFSVPQGCRILRDNGILYDNETTMQLLWTGGFTTAFNQTLAQHREEIPKRETFNAEVGYSTTQREYHTPALKKKKLCSFNLLVAGPNGLDLSIDNIGVGVYEPDIEIKRAKDLDEVNKSRIDFINTTSLLIYLASMWPVITYSPTITVATGAMFVSIFVAYYGAMLIHYLYTFIREYFKH